MPAAAVTPAPIAYIKVVAVKKLVVGCDDRWGCRWWSGCGRHLPGVFPLGSRVAILYSP